MGKKWNESLVKNKLISKTKQKTLQQMSLKNMKCKNEMNQKKSKSLIIVLINMVTILMSAKMATLGLLKIRSFWIKVYDVIISAHDVTNKFLSHDSNNIDVVMWPKFSNCIISMRKVIITSIL